MEASRWYVEGLLHPVAVRVDETGRAARVEDVVPQIHWLDHLERPLVAAYLDRPLGEIVRNGPPDYVSVLDRINRSVEIVVELELSVENGLGLCRKATIRPGREGGHITGIPRLPLEELIRAIGAIDETDVAPRPRKLAAIAEEAAQIYLGSPKGPARAVGEHFGWTKADRRWRDDGAARARVFRVLREAERQGLIETPPSERRRRTA
jgi:hypothetical protein